MRNGGDVFCHCKTECEWGGGGGLLGNGQHMATQSMPSMRILQYEYIYIYRYLVLAVSAGASERVMLGHFKDSFW